MFKSFLFSFACLAQGVCIASSASEIISNPSFEERDSIRSDAMLGWVKYPPEAQVVWDSQVSHDGRYSVRIDASGPKGSAWMMEDRFPITAGSRCVLSGWIKTDNAWGNNQIRIAWYNAKGKWIDSIWSAAVNGTKDWTQVSLDVTAPDGTASARVLVGRRFATPHGQSWFDDIKLEVYAAADAVTVATGSRELKIDWSAPRIQPESWSLARSSAVASYDPQNAEWLIPLAAESWETLGLDSESPTLKPLVLSLPAKAGTGWISRAGFPVMAGMQYEVEALVSLHNALGGTSVAIVWTDSKGKEVSRAYSKAVNGTENSMLLSVAARAPARASSARVAFLHKMSKGAVFEAGTSVCEEISIRELSSANDSYGGHIFNASLEDSQSAQAPANWSRLSAEQAVLEWKQGAAYSGQRAIEIKNSHGMTTGWGSDAFVVAPNETYTLSFKLRLEAAHNVHAGVEWFDAKGRSLALTHSEALGGMLPWSAVTMTVRSPKQAAAARVFVAQSKSSGTAKFDDFSFMTEQERLEWMEATVAAPLEIPTIPSPSSSEILVVQQPQIVDVYMKGSSQDSSRWLRYRMQNLPRLEKRSDVWRWNEVWEMERTGPYTFKAVERLSRNGEVEMAIKQKGKSDFMGGSIHGNEMKTDAEFFVDGELKPWGVDATYSAQLVEFRQDSDLFEVDLAEAHRLAHAHRSWSFQNGEVLIEQEIQWEEPIELEDVYLAMLPLERQRGDRMISSYGARSPDWEIEDLQQSGFDPIYSRSDHALAWGAHGYQAEVEIIKGWEKAGREFNFSPAALYNKMYFDFTGKGYRTQSGEVIHSSARFRVNTSN